MGIHDVHKSLLPNAGWIIYEKQIRCYIAKYLLLLLEKKHDFSPLAILGYFARSRRLFLKFIYEIVFNIWYSNYSDRLLIEYKWAAKCSTCPGNDFGTRSRSYVMLQFFGLSALYQVVRCHTSNPSLAIQSMPQRGYPLLAGVMAEAADNILRLRQNGRYFADNIFKIIFLNGNSGILIQWQ